MSSRDQPEVAGDASLPGQAPVSPGEQPPRPASPIGEQPSLSNDESGGSMQPPQDSVPAQLEVKIEEPDSAKADADDGKVSPDEPEKYVDVTWPMLIKEFSILGWIGFGGPAAHIGLFQKVIHRPASQQIVCALAD